MRYKEIQEKGSSQDWAPNPYANEVVSPTGVVYSPSGFIRSPKAESAKMPDQHKKNESLSSISVKLDTTNKNETTKAQPTEEVNQESLAEITKN